jgi:hypothetical protein
VPESVQHILAETDALQFNMISEPKVGALLAAVAASKPGGRFLELGTGTGHGTAWLEMSEPSNPCVGRLAPSRLRGPGWPEAAAAGAGRASQ